MSFWDSFSSTLDSLGSKVEAVANTAANVYGSVTKYKTAKADNDTARKIAEINAQTQLQSAKNGNIGVYRGWEEVQGSAAANGSQPSQVVIKSQGESGGGMLLVLAAGAFLLFNSKKGA